MKQLLKALKARHSIVAAKIDEEQRRPRPDGIRVRALKKIKLHLKEQITLLERGDGPQGAQGIIVIRKSADRRTLRAETRKASPMIGRMALSDNKRGPALKTPGLIMGRKSAVTQFLARST